MRKKAPKTKAKTIEDILASDDELPTEYIDIPFVPAYQVDDRFECTDEKKDKVHKQVKEQSEHHPMDGLCNGKTVIACGYLNKTDFQTFCSLCLESNTGKKTQQWFFNFLMLKDLQANYTFLTTCLVPSWGIANRKTFKECT